MRFDVHFYAYAVFRAFIHNRHNFICIYFSLFMYFHILDSEQSEKAICTIIVCAFRGSEWIKEDICFTIVLFIVIFFLCVCVRFFE